jgi:hypothetical protein
MSVDDGCCGLNLGNRELRAILRLVQTTSNGSPAMETTLDTPIKLCTIYSYILSVK